MFGEKHYEIIYSFSLAKKIISIQFNRDEWLQYSSPCHSPLFVLKNLFTSDSFPKTGNQVINYWLLFVVDTVGIQRKVMITLQRPYVLNKPKSMRLKNAEKRWWEITDVGIVHQGAGGSCPSTGPMDTNPPARCSGVNTHYCLQQNKRNLLNSNERYLLVRKGLMLLIHPAALFQTTAPALWSCAYALVSTAGSVIVKIW